MEQEVADLFRRLGTDVEHNVELVGNQIDIVVQDQTHSGLTTRIMVECKCLNRPVGVAAVVQAKKVFRELRQEGLVHLACIVSNSGFSRQARHSAKNLIELLHVKDLQHRVLERERGGGAGLPGEPIGRIEHILPTPEGDQLFVRGWAIDPNVRTPARVCLTLDDVVLQIVDADLHRPDLAREFPVHGGSHGYQTQIPRPQQSAVLKAYVVREGKRDHPIGRREL